MSGSISFISAVVAGFGLLLSSPLGPARLPVTDMEELRNRASPAYGARIRDASGRDVGELFRDGPLVTPLELLPRTFLNAVMAIEDRRFYEHDGIDPIGLVSAIASQFGPNPRGGSTIDQQMAKNAWTGSDETLNRKIAEAVLAMRARHLLGPEGVMQAYLETAWFGRGVTGAAGAAHAWFGRDWDDLTLGEMAYLAGILKGPGFYDAERQPQRAAQRRDQVIAAMLREGFITEEEAEEARAETLRPAPRSISGHRIEDRWFYSAARPEIVRALDSAPRWPSLLADVEVELTLSPEWQQIAQEALASGVRSISGVQPFRVLDESVLTALREARETPAELRRLARPHLTGVLPWDSDARAAILLEEEGEEWTVLFATGAVRTAPLNAQGNLRLRPGQVVALRSSESGYAASGRSTIEGAVVILDPRDGSLIASIGGSDPSITAFDRTRARRQPGSAIKTFLWLAALENGYHPDTQVPDLEQNYYTDIGELWRPRNYNRSQSGWVSLSWAYERSSNLVAAALINQVGVDNMAILAERAGAYTAGMPRHLSAALGTVELTLVDLTRAHAAVVNDGVPREVSAIRNLRIDGEPLITDGAHLRERWFPTGPITNLTAVEDMLGMMRGVVRRGTAANAFANHPVTVAGKTGTSQAHRDAWFIGVTPHVAVGVWLGRDDDRPMDNIGGGRYAAPIVAEILRNAYDAGLISAEGYRDSDRYAHVSWPPELRSGGGGGGQMSGAVQYSPAPVAAPIQVLPAPQQVPSTVTRSTPRQPQAQHDPWSMGGAVRAGER